MGELVSVGRADSFCLMNRFQACIWVRTKTGSPSSLALFFILGGGKDERCWLSRAHNGSYHPPDAQRGVKKVKSLRAISTKPQSEFVRE